MTSLSPVPPTDAYRDPPYVVDCFACSATFDALLATWCQCIVKERTLLCPQCSSCFCRADVEYKRTFWSNAPDAVWERKQRSTRDVFELPPNPPVDQVRRPLVLVVDDDREICALAVQLIERSGFGCIHAANGIDGLALARTYHPDLILTDALMPKMDGRELCRQIKSDADMAATRVVIMSSVYTAGRFKREALSQFKADEYVSKPINPKTIVDYLNTRRSVATTPDDAWVPPASIDLPQPRLTVATRDDGVMVGAPVLLSTFGSDHEEEESAFEFAIEDRSLPVPRFSAQELIRMRALGLNAKLIGIASRIHGVSAVDLIALRVADIPADFIAAIEPDIITTLTTPDVIALHGSGCDAAAINLLRRLEFDAREIIGIVGTAVPLQFVRDVLAIAHRRLSAGDILRIHCAGLDASYVRSLFECGFEDLSVEEWIRLFTIGITSEFIETARELLRDRCTADDLTQLWLTGVDLALLRELRA